MDLKTLLTENQERLNDFVNLSQIAGARADYVQGGGGNTSVKLSDGLMAIKASGYFLSDIAEDRAYAVLDAQALRDFYQRDATDGNQSESVEGIEEAGSQAAKMATQAIEGMAGLRPSVEAGFHSILPDFVLHTHAVYANLLCCCEGGREIVQEAMQDAPYTFGFVPYVNPGVRLTLEVQKEIRRVQAQTGEAPSVIFMENHGIIAADCSADVAVQRHDDANMRIAAYFGVSETDFPSISIQPLHPEGAKDDKDFISNTAWLQERLVGSSFTLEFFMNDALYPDQLVFLADNILILESESERAGAASSKCTIVQENGKVYYNCGEKEALTIEQTICCILFICEIVQKSGRKVQSMSAAGKNFIANWESEAYRKSIIK